MRLAGRRANDIRGWNLCVVAIALLQRVGTRRGILEDRPEGADEDDENGRKLEGRQYGDSVGDIDRRRNWCGDPGKREEYSPQALGTADADAGNDTGQRRRQEAWDQDGE